MSTQLHNQVIIFPDGSCGKNTPVADTSPIILENILLDPPKNSRFYYDCHLSSKAANYLDLRTFWHTTSIARFSLYCDRLALVAHDW